CPTRSQDSLTPPHTAQHKAARQSTRVCERRRGTQWVVCSPSSLFSPRPTQTSTKPTLSTGGRRPAEEPADPPMPPSTPPLLLLLLLLLILLPLAAAHAHTTRRLLQTQPTISPAPPPPPPPPHRHHRHTPPAPSSPSTPPQPPAPPLPPQPLPPPPPRARHHRTPPQTPSPAPPPNTNLAAPAPPTPRFSSTSTAPVVLPTPVSEYPFTNYPFFPSFSPPPPPPTTDAQTQPSGDGDASRTFPANISTLVAPNAGSSSNHNGGSPRFPVLQALLLA
uniref:Uncharacterized protein n=1 Tax=Aegilops tauschii subsp. strangulata TaxID=200361 RepID=A0A452XJ86_AEGTS